MKPGQTEVAHKPRRGGQWQGEGRGAIEQNRLQRISGEVRKDRTVDDAFVAGCRKIASEHRQLAKSQYEQLNRTASQWEYYANLLEQGLTIEDASRRAFKQRIGS